MAAEFGPLVNAQWLAAHLDDVVVADVRWYLDGRSGRAAYDAGHLPGAVFVDLDRDLAGPPTPETGRHPLPDPRDFATAMNRLGIGANTKVVAYDDAGGSTAARLWWLLHALGQPVAVLDGGLTAWPGPLVTEPSVPRPVARSAQPWPRERFVGADAVANAPSVIDARTPARYAEGDPGIDPRPGHIPGARSAFWRDNLDETGRFRAPAELATRFANLPDGRTVAYCGSGVTACHDLLALTLAGRYDLALYPGSWSQWGADAARPARTGAQP